MSAEPTEVFHGTPEEIAARFIGSGAYVENRRKRLAESITAAIAAERERCAGIAKWAFDRLDALNTEDAGVARQVWIAIREGKPR